MPKKSSKPIVLTLKHDREYRQQIALTRQELLLLKSYRQDKIPREEIMRLLPQLNYDAYKKLTIKQITTMLKEQPYKRCIWVAYYKKR